MRVQQALRHQHDIQREVAELALNLTKILAYAKACCGIRVIPNIESVSSQISHLVIKGACLIDECAKTKLPSESHRVKRSARECHEQRVCSISITAAAIQAPFNGFETRLRKYQTTLDKLKQELDITVAIDTNMVPITD